MTHLEERRRRRGNEQDATKYGEQASKSITSQDGATNQAGENIARGKPQKDNSATVMDSAVDVDERHGVVGHFEIAREQSFTRTEADVGGKRTTTEAVDDQATLFHQNKQLMGKYTSTATGNSRFSATAAHRDTFTIGEALEAAALSARNKPIDQGDAAAIQAAEVRATGSNEIAPGGIGATAHYAATCNVMTTSDEKKTKLGDVLVDATTYLQSDKTATTEDAQGVARAELRNNSRKEVHGGGVADAVNTAANLTLLDKFMLAHSK